MSEKISDLDAWKALGPILERFVRESEESFRGGCVLHASLMLNLLGVEEDHPVRARAAHAFDELTSSHVVGAVYRGQLGHPRDFARLSIARELLGNWEVTDEALELIADPWASFWSGLASSSLPWPLEPPEGAFEALSTLAEEVTREANDRASPWPLFSTGDDADELVAKTLAQVASRTGISLDTVPVAPPRAALKELPMMRTDAAWALDELHAWASEREDMARAFGVLMPYLRAPR
jgi:hypothetical protein